MEKFIVAFIGTLILLAIAAGAVFVTVTSLTFFGAWGMIVPALIFATLVGLVEASGK